MSTIYQELFDIAPGNEQFHVGSRIFHHPHFRSLADHDILLAGVSYLSQPLHVERKGAPFHVVLISVEGEGEVIVGDHYRRLGPQQLAILPAHSHTGFRFSGGNWRLAWFLLNEGDLWPEVTEIPDTDIAIRTVTAAENLFMATALLCLESRLDRDAHSGAAMLLAVDLLRRMLASSEQGDAITQALHSLFDEVRREPAKPWRVEQLAARYGVGRAHFQRLCLRYLGVAPQQMIINLRMTRARDLLQAGFGNVSAVAQAVGYEEVASFSRRFRRHFGVGAGESLRELKNAPKEIAVQK